MIKETDGRITQMKSSIMENLINAGAFDKLYKNRERLLEHYAILSDMIKNAVSLSSLTCAIKNYEMPDILPADKQYNMQEESKLLNSIVSIRPLDGYMDEKAYGCIPFSELAEGNVKVMGFIVEQKKKYSKKGNLMQVYMVEGMSGKLAAIQMGDALDYTGRVVALTGSYQKDTLFVRSVKPLSKGIMSTSYIIRSLEDNNRIKDIYQEDYGEKNYLIHIINYATKGGGLAEIPSTGNLRVSEQTFKKIKGWE